MVGLRQNENQALERKGYSPVGSSTDIYPVLFRDEVESQSTGINQQPVLSDFRQSVLGNWDSLGVVT
jgi:hypothetical protein